MLSISVQISVQLVKFKYCAHIVKGILLIIGVALYSVEN